MVAKPKLLIVSYLFPPAGGIAVQRALSFARHLPSCGFEVHVLAAWNPTTPVWDAGLLKRVPPEVAVHHAFTPEPPFRLGKALWEMVAAPDNSSECRLPAAPKPPAGAFRAGLAGLIKKLLCPDPQVLWVPFALHRALPIVRNHGIQAILVTAPPFSAFLIGNALKRRFPHLKLVSDFRDEWLRFYLTDFEFLTGNHHRRHAEQIERDTVELSDLVVAVTRSSLAEIRNRYQEQPDRKFVFIPNGYEPGSFAGLAPANHRHPKMVITHLGTAYKTSSPKYYLDALDRLPERVQFNIETRFVGRIAETERALFFKPRKSVVRVLGFVPQEQAFAYMQDTDYLLLTMNNDFSLPGKLFDYLACCKPILALSPAGGEVARILAECGAGWCVEPFDRAAIERMLLQAYRLVGSDSHALARNWPAIRQYERPRLAAALANAIRDGLSDASRI